jgi:hypothetical protein
MLNIVSKCKRVGLVSAAVFVTVAFTPVAALADGTQQCTPPPSQTGVNRPVGADAGTYTYDCTSGLWTNAHFSFNPATGQYTALDPAVYTYDPATGQYDMTVWVYNAPNGNYVATTQSVATPPAGATVVGAPVAPPAPGSDSISNTGPDSNNTINDNGGAGSGSISNTGPDSNNTLGGTVNNGATTNNTTNATITNLLNGVATSGNAAVIGNTTGGNATSGNAQDIANVVNMLQSSSNALGGKTVTFVANLNGDVNGDLLIDPSALGTVQPATTPTIGNNNLTINNQTNAAINNNINLAAGSGNATVANNTSGGNATSGSAEAIANVVNLIDSAISSGNSFIGVINVNGNFNGNILVPPDLINQLIASNVPTVTISNTGPSSSNTINKQTGSNTTTVNNTNNEGINNVVNSTAASGQASVANNTTAGNATTGNANTTVTAFNLTGSNVIGANDLLVFVNVSGQWVGMIMNAPPGATAAELGGGITQSGPTESNNSTTVNNNTNEKINNNITANAQSGNASVTSNTTGGNATSGNADTAVNLLNVENSNLALTNWFGILFINVFGTWNGNFGIAPILSPADMTGGASPTAGSNASAGTPAGIAAFRFVPTGGGTGSGSPGQGSVSGTFASISNTGPGSNNTIASHQVALHRTQPTLANSHASYTLPLIGCILFALYVVGDVTHTRRQHAKSA